MHQRVSFCLLVLIEQFFVKCTAQTVPCCECVRAVPFHAMYTHALCCVFSHSYEICSTCSEESEEGKEQFSLAIFTHELIPSYSDSDSITKPGKLGF